MLRSKDFRATYDEGSKFSSALFAAFYLRGPAERPARVGFTVPRSVGKAVLRNRIKRRLREAVCRLYPRLGSGWDIVINPRRKAAAAPFSQLREELEKLFLQCGN